jgi:hypothetical protein
MRAIPHAPSLIFSLRYSHKNHHEKSNTCFGRESTIPVWQIILQFLGDSAHPTICAPRSLALQKLWAVVYWDHGFWLPGRKDPIIYYRRPAQVRLNIIQLNPVLVMMCRSPVPRPSALRLPRHWRPVHQAGRKGSRNFKSEFRPWVWL